MSVLDEARRIAQAGRPAEANAHVEQAADAGDAEALLAVAHWRLHGLYGPRDPAQAQQLLDRAGAAGSTEATRLLATLIGNGTGCAPDAERAAALLAAIADRDPLAAAQLDLLPEVVDRAPTAVVEDLSEAPQIRMARGVLSASECAYLIARAGPLLQPSIIVDPHGRRLPHPTRTSASMSFGPLEEDLVIRALSKRLAALTGTDISWGEPLQVLRYAPGQEFKPHLDALPGGGSQRVLTVLVYLNEDYQGGETRFDRIPLDARGQPGDALIFRNVDADGRPDLLTRHAGLPVTAGTKWLATRWIRAAPYDVWTGQ